MNSQTCLKALAIVLIGLWLDTGDSSANDCGLEADPERPRVSLVLGGGGARGAAHIGVLKRLEELRVPIDSIVGTSMGSIIGALYASGMTANEIEDFAGSRDWLALFKDATPRKDRTFRRKRDDRLSLFGPKLGIGEGSSLLPRGAVTGQKIQVVLESTLNQRQYARDFDDLPIPFRAVAADLASGDAVVLGEGNLAIAVRASMSIPAVLEPVLRDGRMLVDGGVVKNLPVDVAQEEMGADIVVAVDVGTPLLEQKELTDILAIAEQLTNLMVASNTREQIDNLDEDDILVVPQLGQDVGSADFERLAEAIPLGYQAATVLDGPLSQYSLSPEAYQRYRSRLSGCRLPPDPTIHFVRVVNRSRFSDEVIRERLHVPLGQPLSRQRLELDIEQIYALGFLDRVSYQLVEDQGQTGLVVEVTPDARGNNLVEYGIDLLAGSDNADISVRLGFLKNDIGEYGGEFRTMLQLGEDPGFLTELYTPLDPDLRWILLPRLSGLRSDFTRFDERGNKVEQFSVEEYRFATSFGREFGKHAALFMGFELGKGKVAIDIGDPAFPTYRFDSGNWILSATYDRLDDIYFPTLGSFASLSYRRSGELLGADQSFEQLLFNAVKAESWGEHAVIGGIRFNTALASDAPIQDQFRAGGITRLAGYEDGELFGQHFGLIYASYRYEVGRTGILPAYVGATIEYGNVADDRDDVFEQGILNGSVYFGYNSPIGPLYAGFGVAETGRENFFLSIGNLFERRQFGD